MDDVVKPSISMPTVLRDSGELIRCLGLIKLPADCLLVKADVSSLYRNIDTKKANTALELLLREGKPQFTRLVFKNNILQSESSLDIYHQMYGITIGTPFTVTAANAFVYMYYHERDIIELCAQHITSGLSMMFLSSGMGHGRLSLNLSVLRMLRMNAFSSHTFRF